MTKIKFHDYGCLGNGWADVFVNNVLVLTKLKGNDALDIYNAIECDRAKNDPDLEVRIVNCKEYGGEGFIEEGCAV